MTASFFRRFTLILFTPFALLAAEPDYVAMLEERLASVVAVEFTIVHELDRSVNTAYGLVLDGEGTVILESGAISDRARPEQLQDFKIYRPGQPTTQYSRAEYIGQDGYTSWHFLRIAPEGRHGLRPITDFVSGEEAAAPAMAATVWGLGLRPKEEDFAPYFLRSFVSTVQRLPERTGVTIEGVAGRGCPVFNEAGEFVGMGVSGFGERFMIYSTQRRRGEMSVLINPDESGGFRYAEEVMAALDRVPTNPHGRPLPWFGIDGIDTLDPEVADFLGLGDGAGLVVSEILQGSPAEITGLLPRDIVIALDGEPLPRLKPDSVVAAHFMREVLRRKPGDTLNLTVLRNQERLEIPIELGSAPQTPKESPRRYFEDLGLTVRETVFSDAVARRADPTVLDGVIVHFVKPNAPVSDAGVRTDDWIKEIDGTPVNDYVQAIELLAAAQDSERPELVLLVSRGGKTAVMRAKLTPAP